MTFVVVFEEDVLSLICGYVAQSGRIFEEKKSFHDVLKCECNVHSAGDLVMCLGEFSGHLGWHIDGFDGFMGVWCRLVEFGRKNVARVLSGEGIMCVQYMVYEREKEEGEILNWRK